MNKQTFIESFGHIADAPGGIDQLRALTLKLAVDGRLAQQDPADEPASDLMERIASQRETWVAVKLIKRPKKPLPLDNSVLPSPPPGWLRVRLGDVVTFEYGKNLPAPKRSPGAVPVYGANGVVGTHKEALVREPCLIVGRKGSAGAVNRSMVPCWPTDVTYFVRPPAGIPLAFLEILLRSLDLHAIARGIKPGLDRSEVYERPVLLPPLSEQHRIVERVAELMGLCEELEAQQAARTEARTTLTSTTLHKFVRIESTSELREALAVFGENIGIHLAPGDGDLAAVKQVRQTILDLAVRGRLTRQDPRDQPAEQLLGQIAAERDRLIEANAIRKPKQFKATGHEVAGHLPSGWALARASDFYLASDSGWSPQCVAEPAGAREWGVLKTSAVSRGVFDAAENKKLPPDLQPRPQLKVRPGDFVMIRASGSKDLVGRGALVTEHDAHLMLSDKHIRLSFHSPVSARFWAILNNSTDVQRYFSAESSGTSTMSNVTRDRIGGLVVRIPPLAEQLKIVETVDTLLALCDDLEHQFSDGQNQRRGLSASIIAHALTVELP